MDEFHDAQDHVAGPAAETESDGSDLIVKIESDAGKVDVKIWAKAVELVFNKPCVSAILQVSLLIASNLYGSNYLS